MKLPLALALLTLPGIAADAPTPITPPDSAELRQLLQRGLFEEEATRDLGKAAAAYSALLSQYDTQRTIAATALFRLAEIRLKQNNPTDAILLYKRLLAEFPSQDPLASLSRERMAKLQPAPPAEIVPGTRVVENDMPTAEEFTELVRLRQIAKNSPDLLEAEVAPGQNNYSPLENAAAKGWVQVTMFLLEKGVPIKRGKTESEALKLAASAGHKRIVELLLDRGGDSASALRAASEGARFEIIKFLFSKGADPNAVGPYGYTALLAACSSRSPSTVTRLLLEKGANPNAGKGPSPERRYLLRPLAQAASSGDLELVNLLLEHKADPNLEFDDSTALPLLQAIRQGQTPIVAALLKAGAKPDIVISGQDAHRDSTFTPGSNFEPGSILPFALRKDLKIAKMLIEHGASVKAKDSAGNTLLQLALLGDAQGSQNSSTPRPGHPQFQPITPSKPRPPLDAQGLQALREFCELVVKGMTTAEINTQAKDGNSALHYAMSRTDLPEDFFRWLIAKGADPLITNKNHFTPLDLCPLALATPLERDFRYAALQRKDAIAVLMRLSENRSSLPQYFAPKDGQESTWTVARILEQTVAPDSLNTPPPTQQTPNGPRRISRQAMSIPFAVLVFRADAQGKFSQAGQVTIDIHSPAKPAEWPALRQGDIMVLQQLESTDKADPLVVRKWLEASGAVKSAPKPSQPDSPQSSPPANVPGASASPGLPPVRSVQPEN